MAFQNPDVVEFEDVRVIRETSPGAMNAGAILVRLTTGEEAWIPKAAISDDSEVYKAGTTGKLVIPERLATEKGLV